jgi:NitT/TauT family transport system substrate-binding protein
MLKLSLRSLFLTFIILLSACSEPPTQTQEIKLAVLEFGTVNWTLQTIKQQQLDKKHGFILNIQPLASTQATKIALQAHATNIIVADWAWTIGQRLNNFNYQFTPYSSAAGALIVPANSPIQTSHDLSGIKLGIAGGGLDKNWLFLKALSNQSGVDLEQHVEKVFGAPPLLNNLLQRGEVDALINYWHYSARLQAQGFRKLLDTHDILNALGIQNPIPILGYIFDQQWARQHADILDSFLTASQQAADLLCTSDKAWQANLPNTKTADPATQKLLRKGYCDGRVSSWGLAEKSAILDAYEILAKMSKGRLLSSSEPTDMNVFWKKSEKLPL